LFSEQRDGGLRFETLVRREPELLLELSVLEPTYAIASTCEAMSCERPLGLGPIVSK
jgi:hypothetical protein